MLKNVFYFVCANTRHESQLLKLIERFRIEKIGYLKNET